MPRVPVNGIRLHYEEVGQGLPWSSSTSSRVRPRAGTSQVRFFARRYRTITFNARGYPPSDVPTAQSAYSQDQAVEDIRGLLDALGIERAHVCGLSMGGYATLHFGIRHPDRALSLVVAAAGTGACRRNACSGSGTSRPRPSGSSPSPWRQWPMSTARGRRGCSSGTRTRRVGRSSMTGSPRSPASATASRCAASS